MTDQEMLPPDSVDSELEDVQAIDEDVLAELTDRVLVLHCVKGRSLTIQCYRGFAPAKYISAISQPDVFNQYSNPQGTQRELSSSKAKDAYAYLDAEGADPKTDLRFCTEVVLNIRNKDVVEIKDVDANFAEITIFLDRIRDSEGSDEGPDISRVEGNHRLTYAHGYKKMPPLDVPLSFCLMVGVDKMMEAKIFKDINSNQKPMQTSHLDNIEIRLDEMGGAVADPSKKMAEQLSKDVHSPFLDLVYKGGKKAPGQKFPITARSLATLIRIMQSKSTKLASRPLDEQYQMIRAYWKLISGIFKEEWADKGQRYLMMRSAGTIALAIGGATAVDDLITLGKIQSMAEYLEPLRGNVDWKKDGPLQGLNGVGGAYIIHRRFLAPFMHASAIDEAQMKRQIEALSAI